MSVAEIAKILPFCLILMVPRIVAVCVYANSPAARGHPLSVLIAACLPACLPACLTQTGDTPLHRAVLHKRCALALLERGADPHAADQHGVTPLDLALRTEVQDVAAAMIACAAGGMRGTSLIAGGGASS